MASYLIRQLALGLAELHQFGQTAVDIRPTRVWLESGELPRAKIFLDAFQQATTVDWSRGDLPESLAERAGYYPPELVGQDRVVDSSSDIYGLGCLFFRILSGHEVFPSDAIREKINRHVTDSIPPLEPFGVPVGLAKLVVRMLARDPGDRLKASHVAGALTEWIEPQWLDVQASPVLASLEPYLHSVREHMSPVVDRVNTHSPSEAVLSPVEFSTGDTDMQSTTPDARQSVTPDARQIVSPKIGIESLGDERLGSVLTRHRRSTHPQRSKKKWPVIGGLLALLLAFGWYFLISMDGTVRTDSTSTAGSASENAAPAPKIVESTRNSGQGVMEGSGLTDADATTVSRFELVTGNDELLWGSPTQGMQIDLRYAAPDASMFLLTRPAALVSSDEGRRLLEALGPEFKATREAWEQSFGIPLEQIREMFIGFHPAGGKMPRKTFVVRLLDALDESVVDRWGVPVEADNDQGLLYTVNGGTLFLPTETGQRTLVVGSADDIQQVVLNQGAAPLLRRELEQLVMASDADRHFTLIAAPHFFFADGRPLLSGQRAKLLKPLGWLLGDGLQGVSASVHLGDGFYWEVRLIGRLDHKPGNLAASIEQRLDEVPGRITEYLFTLDPPAYWRSLARDFPFMIEETRQMARIGYEENQVIVNGYLYPYAAHNLMLGSELAIASNPIRRPLDVTSPLVGTSTSLRDYLQQQKIDLTFAQRSLDVALNDLENELNDIGAAEGRKVKIEIAGPDLQSDGITRNQQIANFEAKDMVVADVLTALAIKANPVPGIDDTSDTNQKLVWVLVPDPAGGSEIVLFTTRKAAQEKGYELPAPFLAKKNVQ